MKNFCLYIHTHKVVLRSYVAKQLNPHLHENIHGFFYAPRTQHIKCSLLHHHRTIIIRNNQSFSNPQEHQNPNTPHKTETTKVHSPLHIEFDQYPESSALLLLMIFYRYSVQRPMILPLFRETETE